MVLKRKWKNSESAPKAAQKHGVGGNATVTMESKYGMEKRLTAARFLSAMIKIQSRAVILALFIRRRIGGGDQ